MAEQAQAAGGAAATTTAFDATKWLDQATNRMKVNDDPSPRKRGLDALNQFVQNALQPGQVLQKDVEANIKFWINAIDKKLTAQLNEILHHPEFQRLEGTWRGLHYLVHQSRDRDDTKDPRPQRHQGRAPQGPGEGRRVRLSETFKKVYEDEYGILGGTPTACSSATTSST